MRVSKHDPLNYTETARLIALGIRIARRQELGKPTRALEREADRIHEKALEREADRAKARRKK